MKREQPSEDIGHEGEPEKDESHVREPQSAKIPEENRPAERVESPWARDARHAHEVGAAGVGAASAWVLSRIGIDKLDEYLRGERSAVETYELALKSIREGAVKNRLRELCESHRSRVADLVATIRSAGGEPSHGSGAWGTLARTVQRGADLIGGRTIISSLEEGELRGLRTYMDDLMKNEVAVRDYVEARLLPEQRKTHDLCHALARMTRAT